MKKIGLIGFGCVGEGLYRLLESLEYPHAKIEKIVVKDRNKQRIAPNALISFNFDDVLSNPQIDIVIEVIDDSEVAFRIAKEAISNGKNFISANKKMIAQNLEELTALAELHQVNFRYESAVCGAIPIIQTVDRYFSNEPLKELRGIFNGTSNYILSKIFNENLDYKLALKQAQDLGFAESDPTADVGGFDPKYKLVILALHAFGVYLDPHHILNIGIDQLTKSDIDFAKSRDQKIKLVPTLYKEDNRVTGFVLPQFVSSSDRLFLVENEFNAVSVEAPFAGDQFLVGRGAGAFPTAAAILSDIQQINEGQKYRLNKSYKGTLQGHDQDVLIEVYTRFSNDALRTVFQFESISEGSFADDQWQITGFIALSRLKEIAHLLKRERAAVIATGRKKITPIILKKPVLEESRTKVA